MYAYVCICMRLYARECLRMRSTLPKTEHTLLVMSGNVCPIAHMRGAHLLFFRVGVVNVDILHARPKSITMVCDVHSRLQPVFMHKGESVRAVLMCSATAKHTSGQIAALQ